jgi:TetR/AcrR family transcriptional regulator, regulator of autoinduction and epiphytic fitness
MPTPTDDPGRRARKRIQMLAHLAATGARLFDAHGYEAVARRKTFASRIGCVLDASAAWCEQHPAYLLAYLRHRFLSIGAAEPASGGENGSDIALVWRQLIAAGQQSGELNGALRADQLATWFHHLYLAAMLRWLTVPGLSLKREFQAVAKLFVEGAEAKN